MPPSAYMVPKYPSLNRVKYYIYFWGHLLIVCELGDAKEIQIIPSV